MKKELIDRMIEYRKEIEKIERCEVTPYSFCEKTECEDCPYNTKTLEDMAYEAYDLIDEILVDI